MINGYEEYFSKVHTMENLQCLFAELAFSLLANSTSVLQWRKATYHF